MEEIIIAGIGQTQVGEHWQHSIRKLAWTAMEAAIQDAGNLHPQVLFVANMLAPTLSHQAHLGALIADFAHLGGIEAATIEAGGASGGAALRYACLAIASGEADVALAVGVEKFTDQIEAAQSAALSSSTDSDYEAVFGITPATQAAMLMQRYLHEFTLPKEVFAGFSIIAHKNGEGNPNAMFRKAISLEAYLKAPLVHDPLNIFDIAPNADGAAAVLLTRRDLLPPNFSHPLVGIKGSSLVTDTIALHDRQDPLLFSAASLSVEKACRQAKITPLQVDLFELCDAYSIYAALSLEAAGFAQCGEGWKLAEDGCLDLKGSLPISTCGGYKARGNPGGASGVYQAVEAVLQLRGEAGSNQVQGARRALIQCLANLASTAVTHVLEIMN